MASFHFIALSNRALIALSGEERRTFLQGLVSNDIRKVSSERALYSAFLTPQGKYLHDFFVCELNDSLLLEAEGPRRADFQRRLSIYKLRSKVALAARDDLTPFAIFGDDAATAFGLPEDVGVARPFAGGIVFVDPRLAPAGLRAWLPEGGVGALIAAGGSEAEPLAWERHRIGFGLPDGSRDMIPDKSILLENGFDELNGVDWDKGCYMGQELTARTKYRGLIKKRLLPVTIEGPAPKAGEIISLNGAEAGEMRSHAGSSGLALLRLEALENLATGGELTCGEAVLHPGKPDWMKF